MDNYYTCLYEAKKGNDTYSCDLAKVPRRVRHGDGTIYRLVKDQRAFCDKLTTDYGIDCDWLESTFKEEQSNCEDLSHGCSKLRKVYEPRVKGHFDVYDPGSQIRDGLANYTGLAKWLTKSGRLAQLNLFLGSTVDAIDASTMVTYTAQSAVVAMQNVSDLGEKEVDLEMQERKTMIIAFITGFLFMLPAVGLVLEAAELASIARLIALVAEAGNGAMILYDVVEDPNSAPMAIASMLFGGVATKDIAAIGKAAQASRLVTRDVLETLGEDVVAKVDKVRSIRNVCRA